MHWRRNWRGSANQVGAFIPPECNHAPATRHQKCARTDPLMLSMSVRTTGQLQDGCCVSQFCVARRQERRQERTCCLYAGNERNAIFSLSSPRGQSYEVRHQRPHSPEEDGGRCFVWCKIEEGRTVRDLRYGALPRFSHRREGLLRDSPEGNGQAARGRRTPGRASRV